MATSESSRRRALRAEAHHLHPVVSIGGQGLTPAVLHEIDVNLLAHALIKVRVHSDERAEREAFLQRICAELDAWPIQHLGKVLVIYRELVVEEEPAKPGRRDRGGDAARAPRDAVTRPGPSAPPPARADPRAGDRPPRSPAATPRAETRRPAHADDPLRTPVSSAAKPRAAARRPAQPDDRARTHAPSAAKSRAAARRPAQSNDPARTHGPSAAKPRAAARRPAQSNDPARTHAPSAAKPRAAGRRPPQSEPAARTHAPARPRAKGGWGASAAAPRPIAGKAAPSEGRRSHGGAAAKRPAGAPGGARREGYSGKRAPAPVDKAGPVGTGGRVAPGAGHAPRARRRRG